MLGKKLKSLYIQGEDKELKDSYVLMGICRTGKLGIEFNLNGESERGCCNNRNYFDKT